MDRVARAVHRLWGPLDDGRLHATPRFAGELAEQCRRDLSLRIPHVSKWTFGQQLEHLYLASHWVFDRLDESLGGGNERGHLGFWGQGLMVTGRIPRKVFPTIPPLEPQGGTLLEIQPLKEHLHRRLGANDWDMTRVRAATGKSKHPRMKWMSSCQWFFFFDIHHRHHLRIMRDILKAAARQPRALLSAPDPTTDPTT
jgi:hypothetical protein